MNDYVRANQLFKCAECNVAAERDRGVTDTHYTCSMCK
jgi:hypothetical protein